MNPLLSIITLLATLRTDLYNKFNAAMKQAEPLEQFEAGTAARGILHEMDWAKKQLERAGEEIGATLQNADKILSTFKVNKGEEPAMAASRFLDELIASTKQEALTEAITAKKIVSFEDHQNAITSAKESAAEEARTTAETEFNAKLEKINLLATRRKDAVTRIGELAAASISDDVLSGDKHEDAITAIEGRIAKMKENDITAENRPKIYADLVAKADDAAFSSSLEIILEAAGGKLAAAAPAAPKVDPKDGKAPLAAGTGERKKVIC